MHWLPTNYGKVVGKTPEISKNGHMPGDPTAAIRAFAMLFPSELLWERSADAWVSLSTLVATKEIYEQRFQAMKHLGADALVVAVPAIERLIGPLELSDDQAAKLLEAAYVLAGWHLSPWHRARLKTDLKSTINHLKRLERAALKLDAELADLPRDASDILSSMLNARPETDAWISRVNMLSVELHNFAVSLRALLNDLSREGRGRRTDMRSAITVHHLVRILEWVTGQQVQFSTEADGVHSALGGPLGTFIVGYFKLIYKRPPAATIVRLVREAQERIPTSD